MSATRPTNPPTKPSKKPSKKSDRFRSRDWPIEQLPGLSDIDSQKLIACEILTTHQLLQRASQRAKQQALAIRLQLRVQQIQKWVAMADLARVPNVGIEYCGLLLHCGVATVAQLAQLSVHRLHPHIRRFQVATLQRQDLCPGPEEVTLWIQQARQLSGLR